MTRPRKPRAKAVSCSVCGGSGTIASDPGATWLRIPAGKVAFLRDVAAHRKNAREGMRKHRANLKLKEAGSGKAAE